MILEHLYISSDIPVPSLVCPLSSTSFFLLKNNKHCCVTCYACTTRKVSTWAVWLICWATEIEVEQIPVWEYEKRSILFQIPDATMHPSQISSRGTSIPFNLFFAKGLGQVQLHQGHLGATVLIVTQHCLRWRNRLCNSGIFAKECLHESRETFSVNETRHSLNYSLQ